VTADRITTSRRISAPAAVIFGIVADPKGHAEIDGSGMIDAAVDARPITSAGDTFDMDMDRTPLNDIPGLVKYKVRNIVTRFRSGQLVEWTVGGVDMPPVNHVYGWLLDPVSDDQTDVYHYCDWTNISDKMRTERSWPIVPIHMLETSIANLERIAEQRANG
jgi:hypothetical protein